MNITVRITWGSEPLPLSSRVDQEKYLNFLIFVRLLYFVFQLCPHNCLKQKPDMDVAVKTIMKKNIPKTQSLLKKEIDILRVNIFNNNVNNYFTVILFFRNIIYS